MNCSICCNSFKSCEQFIEVGQTYIHWLALLLHYTSAERAARNDL